jgi:hypothetical protein
MWLKVSDIFFLYGLIRHVKQFIADQPVITGLEVIVCLEGFRYGY